MGKHINKSKRHKKLKFVDPSYNGHRNHSKKRLLPNEPPTEGDYQEVPNRAGELMDLKAKLKKNQLKRRKKKKKKILQDDFIIVKTDVDNEPGIDEMTKKLPRVVKQRPFENKNKFFNRLQKMADGALAEAKVEEKYNINLVSIDEEGNAKYVQPKKEHGERKKEKRKMHKQKVIAKKKLKLNKKEFDFKKDDIQFGEVVTAPPVLTTKPRKAPEVNQAGKKNLALKKLLNNELPTTKKPMPLSTKWKDLAPEQRKVIEYERLRAVQMYRILKNKKNGN